MTVINECRAHVPYHPANTPKFLPDACKCLDVAWQRLSGTASSAKTFAANIANLHMPDESFLFRFKPNFSNADQIFRQHRP